ncbi:PREDICTED: probable tRNA (uracil-O(2)-)-methyltransferase, partial [Acropora digitifera]|uniref:probable tRNA (uracil-O(2)-)-methyltransferase n=1 Tax=Acropora digitifera TaxID=70779 RepID=UPI00077AAE62
PTVQWLQEVLLPKLCKWAVEIQPDGKSSKGSLRLVPLDQYTLLYHRLKQQYGEKLVKMWPERTDPQKFVYEDIAIAAYLLTLWEEERRTLNQEQKQSFVDLGCGNGLLVYILSEEGHPGSGIDVRRRKIWDFYGGNTNLQERALDPTLPGLFPDVDWLIGNHSDELTPWIPVMAARSSYSTRYFVLPCCLFDFNCKFVRKNNKATQYRGYLDFVQEVGETCGFHVEEDSLRIPSTKRICQIGRVRTYSEGTHILRDSVIKEMILRRGCDIDAGNIPETFSSTSIKQTPHDGSRGNVQYLKEKTTSRSCEKTDNSCIDLQQVAIASEVTENNLENGENDNCYSESSSRSGPTHVLSSSFQPRPTKEPMRNCTALNRSLKEFIVNTVARNLLGFPLKSDDVCDTESVSGDACQHPVDNSRTSLNQWRRGGQMELSEVAELFDKSTLLQLKNECGGLQTLLRNHYYIFKGEFG